MIRPSDWRDLDRRHVWHPYTQMLGASDPLPVVRAEGAWLELADGRRLLDGTSSWWVNLHGHNHPRLNRALADQAARFAQVLYAGCAHEPGALLAADLAGRTGLPRVFFSDDGSTAVEVALKMAVQHWRHRGEPRRTLFLALAGGYHGDTFGAMAAGGSALFHGAFQDLLFAVRRVRPPVASLWPGLDHAQILAAAIAELEAAIDEDGDRLAAAIVEPIVQGAAGMWIWPPEYLRAVRAATARAGVPLIVDEVFTGFGRTGRFLAAEHAGVVPDLLCLSKGLTAGYLPLGATLASQEIFDSFLSADRARTFFHGHSFTGNALSIAVARESLAIFDDTDALARVAALERLFADHLERLRGHRGVAATRGLGALAVVELHDTGEGYLDRRGPRIAQLLADRGVLLRPLGNVVYFLPPYCVTDAECEHVFATLAAALDQVL